jgi:hypothetical protein
VIADSRLDHLAPGLPLLLTARSPGATGLASSLSGHFRSLASGSVFTIAGLLEGFHGSCQDPVSSPVLALTFVPPFGVFFRLTSSRRPPELPARADAQ